MTPFPEEMRARAEAYAESFWGEREEIEQPEELNAFENDCDGFTKGAHAALESELLRELVEALKKAEYLVVSDQCEECGTFIGAKYHVKPVTDALKAYDEALGAK